MFGAHGGVVSVTIVKDQLNRSKGFGFVEVRCYFPPFTLPPSPPPFFPFYAFFVSVCGGVQVRGGTDSLTHLFALLPPFLSLSHSQMAVKEEGELAIAALDGREIDGRPINVRLGTSKVQPRMRKERTMAKKEGGGELSSLMDDDE